MKRIEFIHVPKTGGSALAAALDIPGPHTPAWHRLSSRGRWDDVWSFAIVRNPWDQAVSWFYYHEATRRAYPGPSEWILDGCPVNAGASWKKCGPLDQLGFLVDPGARREGHFRPLVHAIYPYELGLDAIAADIVRRGPFDAGPGHTFREHEGEVPLLNGSRRRPRVRDGWCNQTTPYVALPPLPFWGELTPEALWAVRHDVRLHALREAADAFGYLADQHAPDGDLDRWPLETQEPGA